MSANGLFGMDYIAFRDEAELEGMDWIEVRPFLKALELAQLTFDYEKSQEREKKMKEKK